MLEYQIITSFSEVEAIADGWRQLHSNIGKSIFTDYDWFAIWWQCLGKQDWRSLHIVIARQDGRLTALLPLAVTHKKRFRILQPIGAEAFYCCDMLCENFADAAELWKVALKSPYYDYAHIRDVLPESLCEQALSSFAALRDRSKTHALKLQWKNPEEWKQTLSDKFRKEVDRKLRQLKRIEPVVYHVCQTEPLAKHIVEQTVNYKTAWCRENGLTGMFDQPGILQYHLTMAEHGICNNSLVLGWLTCGDVVIASHIMYKYKKVLYSYVVATNAEWGKYSPGNQENIYAISWAIENGFEIFDHMQGDFAYKKQISNQSRECKEYTFHNTFRGLLGENIFILRRSLRRKLDK